MTQNAADRRVPPGSGRQASRYLKRIIAMTLIVPCGFITAAHAVPLDWAGIAWEIRSGGGAPCATSTWNEQGVWVDARGWLHLKLHRLPSGKFSCAEIRSVKRFGFGRYAFEISGPIGAIDKNVVFGFFLYPTRDVGPDGTNEIDIEVARWGHADGPQVNYTVWNRRKKGSRSSRVRVPENTNNATFTVDWQDGQVNWASSLQPDTTYGFRDDIANQPQTLSLNLWLFRQPAPEHVEDVEFVVKSLSVK